MFKPAVVLGSPVWRLVAVALALLTLPPMVVGEGMAASGSFTTNDEVMLPPGAQIRLSPSTLYVPSTVDALDSFELRTPFARVYRHEYYVGRATGVLGRDVTHMIRDNSSTYELRDLAVRLEAGAMRPRDWERGYVGLYPDTEATALFRPSGTVALRTLRDELVGNADWPRDGPDHDFRYYSQRVEEPHVSLATAGEISYEGRGTIKLAGGAFVFEARENATWYNTGEPAAADGGVAVGWIRWIVLEFEPGTITLSTREPAIATANVAEISANGALAFRPADGELATTSAKYTGTGLDHYVSGNWTAAFRPIGVSADIAQLDLAGTLDGTDLHAQAVPGVAPRAPSFALAMGGGILVLGIVLGAGAAVAIVRRRLPYHLLPPRLDDFGRARLLSSWDEPRAAAHWLRRALEHDPTIALRVDEEDSLRGLIEIDAQLREVVEAARRRALGDIGG